MNEFNYPYSSKTIDSSPNIEDNPKLGLAEKSFDNLKNEILIPEASKVHQALIEIVSELDKQHNEKGFLEAVMKFFNLFGIVPTNDNVLAGKNTELNTRAYQMGQLDNSISDIQIHGMGGIYANIYLKRQRKPNGKITTQIYPGACSIPQPIFQTKEGQNRVLDRNFYQIVEQIVGVDPWTKVQEMYKNHPYMLNEKNKQKYFYIVNGKKVQIPAKPLLARFASVMGII